MQELESEGELTSREIAVRWREKEALCTWRALSIPPTAISVERERERERERKRERGIKKMSVCEGRECRMLGETQPTHVTIEER